MQELANLEEFLNIRRHYCARALARMMYSSVGVREFGAPSFWRRATSETLLLEQSCARDPPTQQSKAYSICVDVTLAVAGSLQRGTRRHTGSCSLDLDVRLPAKLAHLIDTSVQGGMSRVLARERDGTRPARVHVCVCM